MGRFQRSLLLVRQSFAVLRGNPQLMLFPIISAIVTTGIAISFWVPTFFLTGGAKSLHRENMPVAYYAVGFAFYFVSYFFVIFFNSGLVYCAYQNLTGRPATFQDGMRAASSRIGSILGWTLIAATVGWLLRMVSERAGLVGRIIIGIIGLAWSILTFFVIPIIVVERGSATGAVKQSGELIKKTWGESLIMTGGLGLVMLFFYLAPIPFIVVAAFTGIVPVILGVIALTVIYYLGLSAVAASMTGIYSAALYIYASNGTQSGGFSPEAFQGAFQQKPTLGDRFKNWR